MDARERVLRAIGYQEVDRVPAGLFGTPREYEDKLVERLGAGSYEEMYHALGIDVWHCRSGLQHTGQPLIIKGVQTDIWGMSGQLPPPLSEVTSVDEVEAHPWPNPDDFSSDALAQEIEDHQDFAIVGGINSAVFHIYLWMCGQENGLMHLLLQPEVAEAIIRCITDFWVGYLRKVLEAGRGRVDIIENCNDFGTQRSMFVSAAMFRRFFRPALQRLYDVTKEYGARVMQHSCGAASEIIPDFIEMGADIVNPIQISAEGMDLDSLVARHKGQIAFYGGLDTQYLLPRGPVERIREETRRVINLFGNGGGYILSGSQGLLADIPIDHAIAMFEEGKRG